MFYPVHRSAKIFKAYLKMGNHLSKVRIQNIVGNHFFKKGILIKNSEGVMYKLPANDWITRIMLMVGGYESRSLQLAANIMQGGGVFVDIGANFGLYTCMVAKQPNVETIISVDPNYQIIPTLLANIKLNNVEGKVLVYNTAITADAGFVTLEQPAADNLGTTKTNSGTKGLLNIGSCSLETLLQVNNIKSVSLIKIDIEGNEFSVFEKFDFTKFDIENILLEFNHLSQIPLKKLLAFFKEKGFDVFDIFGSALTENSSIDENNIWLKKQ